jgi:hypothetical protein
MQSGGMKEAMKNILERANSKRIIMSTSGGGAGSILKVELEGNSYFFFYCAWRLEKGDKVLATYTDSANPPDGLIPRNIGLLKNNKIIDVQMNPQYDLIISIENDFVLRIFCDISYSSNETSNLNWEFCLPDEDKIFGVNNSFEIVEDKYW